MINMSVQYGYTPVYTTTTALKVRTGPGIDYSLQPRDKMTDDGRRHSEGSILNSGTRVSILNIVIDPLNGYVWAKIPSGYICLVHKNTTYYKGE